MSQELRKKLKRIKPVIQVKRSIMEKELVHLSDMLKKKSSLELQFQDSKKKYLEGVKNLNILRQDSFRASLEMMESSVSFLRDAWVSVYRELQYLDTKIKQQRDAYIFAQTKLKSAELLEQKYQSSFQIYLDQSEQKMTDEHSLNKYSKNSQRHDP